MHAVIHILQYTLYYILRRYYAMLRRSENYHKGYTIYMHASMHKYIYLYTYIHSAYMSLQCHTYIRGAYIVAPFCTWLLRPTYFVQVEVVIIRW